MMVAVSPHCDDAVFGSGQLLAANPGATVITVFAGRPTAYTGLTAWDEASGFHAGDDPVAARREEDREALAVLGATPAWLDFCDAQYGPSPAVAEVALSLETAIVPRRPPTVLIPLGLFHSDHHLARDAGLLVLERHPEIRWLAYAEAIYRAVPGLVDGALDALGERRLTLTAAADLEVGDIGLKRRAVQCYRSQLRALDAPGYPGTSDILEPERYWYIEAPVDTPANGRRPRDVTERLAL